MAATRITNVIVPEVFNKYVIQRTAVLFALYMSGMISSGPDLNILATSGGKLINMPFWNDLTGDDEVLSDSAPLTVNPITSGTDIAVLLMRGKAFGANDLAKALSGDDPMRAIGDLVAMYKFRKLQTTLIASLAGVFADNVANDSSDMVNDVAVEIIGSQTAATSANTNTFVDTVTGTMGDAWDKITGIVMHSGIFASLQKQQEIDFITPANTQIKIPQFQGKSVVVDDQCPKVAGSTSGFKYTTYFFGPGAFGYGEGGAPVPTETDRDSLQGDDILVHRWHSIMHPRGIAFQNASIVGSSPTNTELTEEAEWDRVYERKNVRLASLVSNDLVA